LKRGKYHIVCSWILLICFVAGQYMVYAHQHRIINGNGLNYGVAKNIPQQTVGEKCYFCDVMHHNSMVAASHTYLNAVAVVGHVYKSFEYNFTSIQLISSGGRAPPISNHFA